MRLILSRLRAAARDDAGFSLVELLVAMALGSIVLTALLTVFINGLTGTARVTDRVEAAQRARLTADRVSTLLQAQVCGADGDAPITQAGPTSITFTANVGDVAANPTRYRIWWDNTTNKIFEEIYPGSLNVATGALTFPSSPTTTKLIGTDMRPGADAGATMFDYYGFDTTGNGVAAAPLTTLDVNLVIAVKYAITAVPERTKQTDPRSTTVQGQAVAGSADPSDPNEATKC